MSEPQRVVMCDITQGGLHRVIRDRHTAYLDVGWHSSQWSFSAVFSGAGVLLERREFGVPG